MSLSLQFHVVFQSITWAFIFPLGVVLGLKKSRYHVPCQILGTVLTIPGFLLPSYAHLGKPPHPSHAHSVFGYLLIWYLIFQVGFGIFLKLHLYQTSRIRYFIQRFHFYLGSCFPIISWTQLLLGGITGLRICFGTHTGQCVSHMLVGSAFVFHGIFLLLMIHFGQPWLSRCGYSQEFLDSCVLTAWGLVKTFTEHGLFFTGGQVWSHRDTQNTVLGIFWFVTGSLGIYLSRGKRRSIIPGLMIIITGWTISLHQQSSPYSDLVHGVFGYTLMAAGLSKLLDVYLFDDQINLNSSSTSSIKFSRLHLTPFLLLNSGIMYLSSTDQQLRMVLVKQIDHSTYTLIQICLSTLIYFFVNLLINLFDRSSSSSDSLDHQSSVEYMALESFDKEIVDRSI
ncbi:uncharacterized protein MELLADRAFT_38759 [Melampsora larici-populina 98AG31]|uniref:Protein YTP1-like C-terminal domain-containing protein n=1 Tax=Melampsora larici-populina (strain 98AG31 / pathotype 3-4-7) TaxID=747676 RepID=F4RZS1_MELLP|nr:uncharacterized protein MELLADRAFT_38759 [Melampsora larici-populina 98AG31]EGG02139.1 hypothetical protein MELLADRAFT_38759 [Melampsora larici-populina 98AG31]